MSLPLLGKKLDKQQVDSQWMRCVLWDAVHEHDACERMWACLLY